MITILIVDDQNFTRRAIQALLEKEQDFKVIGQAANGVEALKFIKQNNPDIALVDLEMPEMNGYNLTYQVSQRHQQTKVVILSACEERESIDTAVQAGARGYLLKTTSGQEIADTIRYVQRGYFQLGPGLFEKIISPDSDKSSITPEDLSRFQNKAEKSLENWEAEMIRRNNMMRKELFYELETQISVLKQDFRQGLDLFQHRVSDRIERGFNSMSDRVSYDSGSDPNLWEKKFNAKEFERQQQMNRLLTGTKNLIQKLERKVNILRNCLIFLAVTFIAEKVAILMFNFG